MVGIGCWTFADPLTSIQATIHYQILARQKMQPAVNANIQGGA